MNLSKPKLIALGIVVVLIILLVLGFIFGRRETPEDRKHPELVVWGVYDDGEILRAMAGDAFPIRYEQFPFETYETTLLNALAAGRGPDVFMMHNTWLPKHVDKITPYFGEAFSIANLRALFPTVVEQDFAPDNGIIYGLPLYIDTLALLYNKDIFDSAGIALTPTTWTEFKELIPRLRQLDARGNLVRAASAIGGSAKSINRATDLISALMLQAGVQMVDPGFGRATFSQGGLEPLLFYTSFANAVDPAFTWNERFSYSTDSFPEESTAMIFNYSYQIGLLKDKYPFLRVGVAPLPQPAAAERKVTYPNYWGFAVAKSSAHPVDGWDLILKLAGDETSAAHYLDATRRPPALRSLIQKHVKDPELGVFAEQALFARSWPQVDNLLVENAFSQMIEDVLRGFPARDAIEKAESTVSERMSARSINTSN